MDLELPSGACGPVRIRATAYWDTTFADWREMEASMIELNIR